MKEKATSFNINHRLCSLSVLLFSGIAIQGFTPEGKRAADDRPNLVTIFADDMGYGDLGAKQ